MADQLFDGDEDRPRAERARADAPLAVRMRPRELSELIGQEHLLAEGSALRVAIDAGRPHSAILYGPPGQRQDDAGADRRGRGRGGIRGTVGG